MHYRLDIKKLREVAAAHGDDTAYKIAQRTGLSQSTISRLTNGGCQPNAATQSRFLTTYRLPIGELMTIADEEQVAA
jgi:transcriptional regulator with XRE-family HTH domain